VLEPAALARIPVATNYDFSKDLFPQMLRDEARLYGHVAHGYWRDVGDLTEYRRANLDGRAGRVAVTLRGERRAYEEGVVWGETRARIESGARLIGTTVLGVGARVGRGVVLENVIVGDGVEIGDGAELHDVVLWEGCVVGTGARINETVLGAGVRVGEGAQVRENTILSDRAEVGAFAVVGPNVKVWPDKVVEERAVLSHSLIWGEAWERSLFHGARVSGIPNAELTPEVVSRLGEIG